MLPKISCVTLTGIDHTVDIHAALTMSETYPLLEWGILLGGAPSPRYPDIEFIKKWSAHCQSSQVKTALHLCGKYARAWIEGDQDIIELARGFGRIQVNVVSSRIDIDSLVSAVLERRHPSIITQHNAANEDLTTRLAGADGHAVLFDASGGRGVGPTAWPAALPDKSCGYAGGLGPDNVASELQVILNLAHDGFWIDMEGKIRTPQDTLDLNMCSQVLSSVKTELNRNLLRSPSHV